MTVLVSFVLGILSSGVFWYFLVRIQPRLLIAPIAVYDPVSESLGVKIMNAGRRQIANIEVHMAAVTRTPENRVVTGTIARLKWPTILALETRAFFEKEWQL